MLAKPEGLVGWKSVNFMHIKTIKGKQYYYESKRIGKKVTSVYIGPVDHELKADAAPDDDFTESDSSDEEFYVG